MIRSTTQKKIKNLLFVGFILALFIPVIEQKFKFIDVKPLNGYIAKYKDPYFSFNDWFNGKYQKDQEEHINQNFGFRNVLVRLYNQVYYSCFKQAKANGVIIGKDEYLYEINYIKAHLGRDFIGQKEIENKVYKLRRLQDTLKTKDIELLVLFAPGKASFYPEYIPDKYNPQDKTTTNYEAYIESMKKLNVNLLDLNHWFVSIKDTTTYPLVPKTGVHWSKYGEYLAVDTLINHLENLLQYNIAEVTLNSTELTSLVRDSDDDIERGMNLLYNIPDLQMLYPNYSFKKTNGMSQPKVLAIADSYYWGMFNKGISSQVFNHGQFWYYNQQIYPDSYKNPIKVKDINIIEGVEKNDVVLIISTDANLYKFAFGFIDQLYAAYYE